MATRNYAAENIYQAKIDKIVNDTVQPLIQEYNIPGMAVAVTLDGNHYFYNYGVMSKEAATPITNQTLDLLPNSKISVLVLVIN